ncbi:MAG: hypothetical protein LBK61_08100, partial [Spirochaetaceae bacterium]|nr:hypothetical protein [Spirochaetaceae bacterium]
LTTGYSFANLQNLADYIAENNFAWCLSPDTLFNSNESDTVADIKSIIMYLRNKKYDLKKFFFGTNPCAKVSVGINSAMQVFSSVPSVLSYNFGEIHNFIPNLLNSLGRVHIKKI